MESPKTNTRIRKKKRRKNGLFALLNSRKLEAQIDTGVQALAQDKTGSNTMSNISQNMW